MNAKATVSQIENVTKTSSKKTVLSSAHSWNLRQPRVQKFQCNAQPGAKSLQKATKSLALAYLVANMNLKHIPLKEFMDAFEKKILLACLRLTRRNQKDAAALLSLKPTALIEKMRKHGIQGRRKKLSREPQASPPRETD
ncbi:MAG: helix-turn-helix domain-containing protein [Chrysiogenia bacterium]